MKCDWKQLHSPTTSSYLPDLQPVPPKTLDSCRQQPHLTHSPCLTLLLLPTLCHGEGALTQNVEHLQTCTPQP
jgi:hypothetical protein